MGKLQAGAKADVKREVVSASANLEVISQESFVKRLEGMSSACHNCHRERTRTQRNKPGRKGKAGRGKQQAKSNTPIVIHLKDTLRSPTKERQSSMDGDSDLSAKSTDEEQYSSSDSGRSAANRSSSSNNRSLNLDKTSLYRDIGSIPEFVPKHNGHHVHQVWPQTFYHHLFPTSVFSWPTTACKTANVPFISEAKRTKKKSRKNLTTLISVIEKAHMKEARNIEPNLSRNSAAGKLSGLMNNASLARPGDAEVKRKNMALCQNVELICNDLSKATDKMAESTDESDCSDKASVVSSTDTLSDDAPDRPLPTQTKCHQYTPVELAHLAEYAIGMPLIRYDCLPLSQCPECIGTAHTNQQFSYEGCSTFTFTRPTSRSHNPRHYIHPLIQRQRPEQQRQRPGHQQHKAAPSPRTSISSDSDASSDVEDNSTISSSSSNSSSTSPTNKTSTGSLASENNSPPTAACTKASKTPQPNSSNGKQPRQELQRKQVKRAAASWESARRADGNFSRSSRQQMVFGFRESVFMDLTGLDVSISVVYHTEAQDFIPSWPYPVHYQPSIPPVLGISSSRKFGTRMAYPYNSDMMLPHELKKYEMSLPPNRPWIMTGSPDKDVPAAVFTVMCYNVLCDKLCTKAMYAYCPTWALSWDYRKKGIMNDILRGNADIITLQEVETEQYYSMFFPELAQQGYDGIFLPKSRVRTMNSDKEKKSVDGCAIFFKKTKFEKMSEYHIEFSQLATKEGASNTDTDMINRVSTKDNIAVVAVLRTKPGVYENSPVPATKNLSQMLMVSTAHIHWDPQSPDVKLVQTMMLLEELQKYVKEASLQFPTNTSPNPSDADLCNSMPIILCGDFNSLPDSGVYEYLSKGRLDTKHKDFEGQNYQVFMKDRNDNGTIAHNFRLTSAYKDVIPFTNYTFDFKGIIDYIFYSHQHLRLHGVMGLQDEEWFKANKIIGCPHPFVPSDHFPLFAEFSLPVTSQQRPR